MLSGWGVRPHDWQYTFSVQQELLPRVAADFSFTHRSFHGFFVTDDLNRRDGGVASYYETYTLTAPLEIRGWRTAAAIRSPCTSRRRRRTRWRRGSI